MKDIDFLGNSLAAIKVFPDSVKRDVGHNLDRIQRGEEPHDWKPMKTIGVGVREIRVKDEEGIFRVIYVVKYLERVHVIHAFQKKTEKTSKKDLDIAKQRLKVLLQEIE